MRMPRKRITIISAIHGKVTRDGKVSQPDVYWVLEKWLERHPEIKRQQDDIRITRGRWTTVEGLKTEIIHVSIVAGDEIAGYVPEEDADLYKYWKAEDRYWEASHHRETNRPVRKRGTKKRRMMKTSDPQHLQLSKGAMFVKSQLRRLPRIEDVWEADFEQYPDRDGWLGVVVSVTDGFILADLMTDAEATVNDLASVLAKAMKRPFEGRAHRPTKICLRNLRRWGELVRHLEELKIEVPLQESLPKAEEELGIFFKEFYGKTPPSTKNS